MIKNFKIKIPLCLPVLMLILDFGWTSRFIRYGRADAGKSCLPSLVCARKLCKIAYLVCASSSLSRWMRGVNLTLSMSTAKGGRQSSGGTILQIPYCSPIFLQKIAMFENTRLKMITLNNRNIMKLTVKKRETKVSSYFTSIFSLHQHQFLMNEN